MSFSGSFRTRTPLTSIESAQCAAALKATSAAASETLGAVVATAVTEADDVQLYGHHVAQILRQGRCGVGSVGHEEDCLPGNGKENRRSGGRPVAAQNGDDDRLLIIAETHGSFCLKSICGHATSGKLRILRETTIFNLQVAGPNPAAPTKICSNKTT